MQPGVRYLRKDVKELPETCYKTMRVPIDHGAGQRCINNSMTNPFMPSSKDRSRPLMKAYSCRSCSGSGGWVYTTTTADRSRLIIPLEWTLCLRCWKKLMEKCIVFVEYIHAVSGAPHAS